MAISVSNGALPPLATERSSVAREVYRPDIDGLRAIAVLAVIGRHVGILDGGLFGVDIFFVISGYLISGLILRALARGSFSSFEFYARRVKRIFPALIVLFAAVSAIGWVTLLSGEYQQLGKEITEGAGFVKNLVGYWRKDADFHVSPHQIDLGHLWSLGVEEQFYLLWPLFLMFIFKLKSRQLALMTGVISISFAISVVETPRGVHNYALPEARLWQLSLGGAFAYMQSCRAVGLEKLRTTFSTKPLFRLGLHNHHVRGLVGILLLVGCCVWFKDWSAFSALAPSIGALLVITAGPTGWVNRYVLSANPLVGIGLISYPVYLWHYVSLQVPHLISPQATAMTTIAAVVATFILSFLTYKYVELPLRHSQKTTLVASALCVVMLACGSLGYVMFLGGIPARPAPLEARNLIRASTEDWLKGTRGAAWTRSSDKFITLGAGSRDVLYIGDSNMQQFYPRIEKLLTDHPLNSHGAVFAMRDWCAPVESDIPASDGATRPECRAFMHSALSYAKQPRIDTIVITACWRCYFMSFEDSLLRSEKLNPGAEEALSNLKREIRSLVLGGKRVYVVLGTPVSPDLDPRSMIRRIVVPPGFRVAISSPKRIELTAEVEPVRSRLVKIAESTGARVIDPMQSLCDEVTCSPISPKGEPMYRDWFDLSPSYVRENVRFLDGTVLDPDDLGPPLTALGRGINRWSN